MLVAAPTGSGKTVVAEHAVARALAEGGKAFYTTPIKALSNQKFADLARRHGAHNVGLLTGDNSINGDAPVVVMTTEVLRNMIYAGSPALAGLRFVVLDEVHYLQDTYRGPVWEEVIIHLPESVSLVCLSATVSNAEEVADWLTTVRGTTRLVLEEDRPVELRNLYLVGDRQNDQPHLLPTLVDGRPNPEAERLDHDNLSGRGPRRGNRRPRRRLLHPPPPRGHRDAGRARDAPGALLHLQPHRVRGGRRRLPRRRPPADHAPTSAARIRAIVDERTAALTGDDLDVLGYDRWVAALEMGLAAHHAGMVPPFKEAVEACFVEGLVKAVFATETLALGVNMPARSVVIERLTKFTGEARAFLTPGEYTQLTGRAGRRGIDALGYAVVLWSPFVPFDQVASLVSSRTYGLRSAFRPTYNMAANLVRRYEPSEAHHLLNLSFAQFQADQEVVRFEARIERQEERLGRLDEEARCDLGDTGEYRRLAQAEREASAPTPAVRGAVEFALARLMPGDVVQVGGHRLAVLSVAHRKGGTIRLKGIDAGGEPVTYGVDDMAQPPERTARIDIPRPYQPNNRAFQHKVADELRRTRRAHEADPSDGRTAPPGRGLAPAARAVGRGGPPRARLPRPRPPPAGARPAGPGPSRAVRHAARGAVPHAVAGPPVRPGAAPARGLGLPRRLGTDRAGRGAGAHLPRGRPARRRGHDRRAARRPRPRLAGGSRVVLHLRAPGPEHAAAALVPVAATCGARWGEIERLAADLRADEDAAGLQVTRAPDPGFVALAHAWAAGEPLGEVLGDEDLSGGDFVRNIKTLIDLVRQVGDVAPDPSTGRTARQAAEALHRGVVSISSTLDEIAGEADITGGAGTSPVAPASIAGGAVRRGGARCPATCRDHPQGRGVGRGRRAARRWGARGIGRRSPADRHRGPPRRRGAVPALGLLGGDLCRTLGGRGDEARIRSDERRAAAGRPGLGPGRRRAALVRGAPGRPPVVVAGSHRGGDERRVRGRLGRRPPGPSQRRPAGRRRRGAGACR